MTQVALESVLFSDKLAKWTSVRMTLLKSDLLQFARYEMYILQVMQTDL